MKILQTLKCLLVVAAILCVSVFAQEGASPEFSVIFQSLQDGQKNVSVNPTLCFEFNLRIDPGAFSVLINGSGDLIEKVTLSGGKRIEIVLKQPLEYETDYTISLSGIKEIYSSQSLTIPEINFTTGYRVEVISESAVSQSGEYTAVVKNYSSETKKVVFIISAKSKADNSLFDVKVISQEIGVGEEKTFSHTFPNLEGECFIKGYGFYEFGNMVPVVKSGT